MREPLSSSRCPGCESTASTTLAPNCYRCTACDLVWGEGLQTFQAAQRAVQMEPLADSERLHVAISELKEADLRLRAAEAWLDEACHQFPAEELFDFIECLPIDIPVGMTGSYAQTRTQTMVLAMQEILDADNHVRRGSDALENDPSVTAIAAELSPWLAQFGTMSGLGLNDEKAHEKAGALRSTVQMTRTRLKRLVSQLGGSVVS